MYILIYATTLDALLTLEGAEFVECCYQTLLNRQPTPDEILVSLDLIQAGVSGLALVVRLSGSREGQAVAADLPGLKAAVKRYKQSRIPLLGCLFRRLHVIRERRRRTMPHSQIIRLTPWALDILSRIEAEANKHPARKGAD